MPSKYILHGQSDSLDDDAIMPRGRTKTGTSDLADFLKSTGPEQFCTKKREKEQPPPSSPSALFFHRQKKTSSAPKLSRANKPSVWQASARSGQKHVELLPRRHAPESHEYLVSRLKAQALSKTYVRSSSVTPSTINIDGASFQLLPPITRTSALDDADFVKKAKKRGGNASSFAAPSEPLPSRPTQIRDDQHLPSIQGSGQSSSDAVRKSISMNNIRNHYYSPPSTDNEANRSVTALVSSRNYQSLDTTSQDFPSSPATPVITCLGSRSSPRSLDGEIDYLQIALSQLMMDHERSEEDKRQSGKQAPKLKDIVEAKAKQCHVETQTDELPKAVVATQTTETDTMDGLKRRTRESSRHSLSSNASSQNVRPEKSLSVSTTSTLVDPTVANSERRPHSPSTLHRLHELIAQNTELLAQVQSLKTQLGKEQRAKRRVMAAMEESNARFEDLSALAYKKLRALREEKCRWESDCLDAQDRCHQLEAMIKDLAHDYVSDIGEADMESLNVAVAHGDFTQPIPEDTEEEGDEEHHEDTKYESQFEEEEDVLEALPCDEEYDESL
ncbi:hypothetical protein BZG36_04230 [Bifiguratus adelaidae]|uniref:Uncharacterized protein n=1 Tax=Bifiguratus adelaidae TaxID=1938954 RepID=A0A261XYK4_9FUNG|nr:hypothetical protein BZG36_04230 [Bifiguratus adelaidae]